MKGQFMVMSSIIISAIVISTASTVFQTSSQEFHMDQTAYKLESIKQEARKVIQDSGSSAKDRENFRKMVESIDGYSTKTTYWNSRDCFNVTLTQTDERLELTCIGKE